MASQVLKRTNIIFGVEDDISGDGDQWLYDGRAALAAKW